MRFNRRNWIRFFDGHNKSTTIRLKPQRIGKHNIWAGSYYHPEKLGTTFDVILADPPYSNEESKQLYGTGKLNYKKWTSEATKFLSDNGLLIVYHKCIMPNPNPNKYSIVKRVFIGNRIYHLPRVAIYFQKGGGNVLYG